jgi:hypothetical protein
VLVSCLGTIAIALNLFSWAHVIETLPPEKKHIVSLDGSSYRYLALPYVVALIISLLLATGQNGRYRSAGVGYAAMATIWSVSTSLVRIQNPPTFPGDMAFLDIYISFLLTLFCSVLLGVLAAFAAKYDDA